jgi:hypothetical protein
MKNGLLITTVAVTAGLLLSGCKPATDASKTPATTAAVGPGPVQGDVAPRLIMRDGFKVWDNPGAFGPVPADLLATGEQVCATMDTPDLKHVPTGYHAKALDADGVEFMGGGYYCVPK